MVPMKTYYPLKIVYKVCPIQTRIVRKTIAFIDHPESFGVVTTFVKQLTV